MKPSPITLINKIGLSYFFINTIFQVIFGLNRHLGFMINFTSRVRHPEKITITAGQNGDFYKCIAESNGVYIQAKNGIELHSCLNIASGVKIVSANHDPSNLKKHVNSEPIKIGREVWLGANVVVLPGVTIGDNVVIGAGSVVTKSLPANVVAVGNPCKVIKSI